MHTKTKEPTILIPRNVELYIKILGGLSKPPESKGCKVGMSPPLGPDL